jgi:hypothetical protein
MTSSSAPTRRPGFKPVPPPPAPREVKRRAGAQFGLWAIRLFILPHTLFGIALLGAMLFLPIWQLCGTESMAPATRAWASSTRRSTNYQVEYVDPVTGKLRQRGGLARVEFDRIAKLLRIQDAARTSVDADTKPSPVPVVRVKTLKIGQWHYSDVIAAGSSGWKAVGGVWAMGLFWNAIIGVFAFMVYVQPWRQWRLRRNGEASPGRIVEKRTMSGSKGRRRYVLKYAFSPGARSGRNRPGGEESIAEQDVTKSAWDAASEGDEVWVLHWPGKAKPSALWEMG